MNKTVNITIFNLDLAAESTKEVITRFSDEPNVEISTIRFYKEVNNFIISNGNSVLLFKIESKAEFVQVLAILKANSELIEKGLLKPACLLGVNSAKVERLLFKYGCRDLLEMDVNPRTLVIKTEMWVRSVSNILKRGDDFLTLGQRSQTHEGGNSENQYDMKSFPEDDLVGDEEQLEEQLNELVDELEEEAFDLELDSLLEEVDEFDEEDALEKNDLHLATTEESSPELVEFISNSSDPKIVNLETGYLAVAIDGQEDANCIFENFEEDHMVLEVSNNHEAQINEKLSVWVKFVYNKCRVEIELSGVVSEIEVLDDGTKHVNVAFDVTEVERYDYFMSLYEKRQKSINDFMELARGY